MASGRSRVGTALLAVVSVGLVLGAAEVGVRVAGLDPAAKRVWQHIDWNAMFTEVDLAGVRTLAANRRWLHRYSSNDRGTFRHGNAVEYATNGDGFRDVDFHEARTPGLPRVAFIGDSFGFGAGLEAGYNAADVLERLLAKELGCPVEVLNFSTPGYAVRHEHRLLRSRVMVFAPDLIVVWYFLNDARGAEEFLRFLGDDEKDRRVHLRTLGEVSALARFLGHRLDARQRNREILDYYRAAYDPASEEWADTRKSLAGMAETAARHRVPALLFVHPMLFRLDADYPFRGLHDQVVATAAELGFEAHDLLPAFEGRKASELWVHPSDQHPNEVAQAIAAAYAAGPIAAQLPACSAGRDADHLDGAPGEAREGLADDGDPGADDVAAPVAAQQR